MLIGLLLPAINNAREMGRQAVSMNNMRNITLAMQNYANAKGQFPDRESLSADGKPLLSWRVQLLPCLGQDRLVQAIPPRRALGQSSTIARSIDLMPAVARVAKDDLSDSKTLYQVVYGPKTIYDGAKAKPLGAIAAGDGLSQHDPAGRSRSGVGDHLDQA